MQLIVDSETCTGCSACITACPLDAITLEGEIAVINHTVCDLDGICIAACPVDAITFAE